MTNYNGTPVTQPLYLVYGQLVNGTLVLFVLENSGPGLSGNGVTYLRVDPFLFSGNSYTGTGFRMNLSDMQPLPGTFSFTRVN